MTSFSTAVIWIPFVVTNFNTVCSEERAQFREQDKNKEIYRKGSYAFSIDILSIDILLIVENPGWCWIWNLEGVLWMPSERVTFSLWIFPLRASAAPMAASTSLSGGFVKGMASSRRVAFCSSYLSQYCLLRVCRFSWQVRNLCRLSNALLLQFPIALRCVSKTWPALTALFLFIFFSHYVSEHQLWFAEFALIHECSFAKASDVKCS